MAVKLNQKTINKGLQKSTKNIKLPTISGGFRGLNHSTFHGSEETF